MRLALAFLLLLGFAASPAWAQAPSAESVIAAYSSLMGDADQRDIYALPPKRYWRADATQKIQVSGARALNPAAALMAIAGDFSAATGIDIGVSAKAEAQLPQARDFNATYIVIAGRPLGARLAMQAGVDNEMQRRFHDGRWPALVQFWRNDLTGHGARSGVVIIADDLPPAQIEAFLGISVVWAMGGASVGEELAILEKPGGRPGLTELGKRVFALMYNPQLYTGMTLEEANATARKILGLPE
jgi:stage V sporulation protein SpoVS